MHVFIVKGLFMIFKCVFVENLGALYVKLYINLAFDIRTFVTVV